MVTCPLVPDITNLLSGLYHRVEIQQLRYAIEKMPDRLKKSYGTADSAHPEKDKFWMGLSAVSDQLSANSFIKSDYHKEFYY